MQELWALSQDKLVLTLHKCMRKKASCVLLTFTEFSLSMNNEVIIRIIRIIHNYNA